MVYGWMDGWRDRFYMGFLEGRRGRVSLVFYLCTDGTYIFASIFWVGVPGSGFTVICKEIIRILKQLSE